MSYEHALTVVDLLFCGMVKDRAQGPLCALLRAGATERWKLCRYVHIPYSFAFGNTCSCELLRNSLPNTTWPRGCHSVSSAFMRMVYAHVPKGCTYYACDDRRPNLRGLHSRLAESRDGYQRLSCHVCTTTVRNEQSESVAAVLNAAMSVRNDSALVSAA